MSKSQTINQIILDLRALAPVGFAAAFHVSYATPRYLFQTYAPDWMEYYSASGVVMDDPAVRWGFTNDGIAPWDELRALDDKQIFTTARDYGLNHWAVVATSEGGSKSIGAFARTDMPFTEEEKAAILAHMTEAHVLTLTAADDPEFDQFLSEMSRKLTHKGDAG